MWTCSAEVVVALAAQTVAANKCKHEDSGRNERIHTSEARKKDEPAPLSLFLYLSLFQEAFSARLSVQGNAAPQVLDLLTLDVSPWVSQRSVGGRLCDPRASHALECSE